VSPFILFPCREPGTNAPKITKLQKPDNNNVPTTSRRKRRRLEVIDTARDAEKDRQELAELVKYASTFNCGAQNAINNFTYPDGTTACRNLSVRQVEHGIKKGKQPLTRDGRSILLETELSELVIWIVACNDQNCGKTRHDIRLKILQILTSRKRAFSKAYSKDRQALELSFAENKIIDTSDGPTDRWFLQFYANNSALISEKAPKVIDSKRHKDSREYAVEKHFYGEFGLSEELIAAGILDPATGMDH